MSPRRLSWWSFASGYRRYYAAAIGALAVATFVAYLIPMVSRLTIDTLLGHLDGREVTAAEALLLGREPTQLADRLWRAAAAIAVLAAFSAAFMHLKGRLAALASEGIIRRLRNRLYDHLQHLPCRYHDRAETGDLVQRCTSDVETVRHFLALQAVEVGRAVLLVTTVIPIMLFLDVPMTFISLAGTPIIVAFSVLFFWRIRPAFLRMEEAESRMTSTLQENLTGIRVVRAFARQDYECRKFAESNRRYRDHHYRLICLLAVFWPVSDVLVFAQQAAVLIAGCWRVAQGSLSVGSLVAFLLFVKIYIWPVRQMGRILTDFGKAMVAWGRITEVLGTPRESDLEEGAVGSPTAPRACRGGIVLEGVSFAYDERKLVLEDVSFEVSPGETLAVVGPSGAGKTTLVSLLLRLYDGFSGSIRLDGEALQTLPRKWVRRQTSVVLQEPFLYSKTVRENIALGRHDAEEQELFEAAHTAAVHDTILAFDQGYETVVGERGVTLSGGQRQRVALARALLHRPAILILDDALSAIDTATETLILKALRQRHGRQTTIVIAHRISTLREADKILVLDRGRVRQVGTHDELRRQPGLYSRLWELQAQQVGAAEHPAEAAIKNAQTP